MGSFIANGGPFMYLILLFAATATILAVLRGWRAVQGRPVTARQVNTVLYLGMTALLLGIVAQLTGIYQAATAILRATAIAPPIVAEGLLISFNSTLLGLYVLVFCAILWFLLRALQQRASAA